MSREWLTRVVFTRPTCASISDRWASRISKFEARVGNLPWASDSRAVLSGPSPLFPDVTTGVCDGSKTLIYLVQLENERDHVQSNHWVIPWASLPAFARASWPPTVHIGHYALSVHASA